jgi:hypothetical protein
MDKLRKVLDSELNALLMQMPKNGTKTTIDCMLNRVQFISNNQELFKNKLNQIGNQFFEENRLGDDERSEIVELLNSYFIRFSKSFG